MTTWNDRELGNLRWHWGSCYNIQHFKRIGLWLAQRRDTGETLKSEDPEQLRLLIRANYQQRRVPRTMG